MMGTTNEGAVELSSHDSTILYICCTLKLLMSNIMTSIRGKLIQ
jgi:hypothetical protein